MKLITRIQQAAARFLGAALLLCAGLQASAQTITYFHLDPSGSPTVATDASGNVVWKENYRPYGDRLNNPAAEANNKVGFAGRPFDAATGLSYMGARYYDPGLGRFMGPDPAPTSPENLNGINRYAYANNNPYKFVDPDGHSPIDVAFLVWDLGKLGIAVYNGSEVREAAVDVAMSLVGVVSPVPGTGQVIKAARAAEKAVEIGRAVEHGADSVRGAAQVGLGAAAAAKGAAVGADNAGNVLKLKNQLASQAQMAEAGTTMAGAGGRGAFRDAQRVASEHGGNAADWVKKTSSSFTDGKGTRFETHWVENIKTGQRVEFKTKFPE